MEPFALAVVLIGAPLVIASFAWLFGMSRDADRESACVDEFADTPFPEPDASTVRQNARARETRRMRRAS